MKSGHVIVVVVYSAGSGGVPELPLWQLLVPIGGPLEMQYH